MLPTTAASTALGVIAFMKAALGLRFAPDFFAAFLAGAFFAAFLAGAFFAAFFAPFLAAGFLAGFLAAFLAVAIGLLPVGYAGGQRASVLKRALLSRALRFIGAD